jgi:hypothetical protein
MDAWTVFSGIKLLLDVIEGGPVAAIKGILMMGIPYSEVLDVGEVVFGLFGLDGSFQGSVVLNENQFISLSEINLLGKEQLVQALAQRNFPELAERTFAQMKKRSFPKF